MTILNWFWIYLKVPDVISLLRFWENDVILECKMAPLCNPGLLMPWHPKLINTFFKADVSTVAAEVKVLENTHLKSVHKLDYMWRLWMMSFQIRSRGFQGLGLCWTNCMGQFPLIFALFPICFSCLGQWLQHCFAVMLLKGCVYHKTSSDFLWSCVWVDNDWIFIL